MTVKYLKSVSSGDVLTTSQSFQEIYFYDPHNPEKRVSVNNIVIENMNSDGTDFHVSINDEWNVETGLGSKHVCFSGSMIGFEDIQISKIIIHQSGSNLIYTGMY